MIPVPRLALRPDTTPGVGSGHVARAFALAEAWTHCGGQAELLVEGMAPVWRDRAAGAGIEVTPPRPWSEVRADWIGFDGYGFDQDDNRAARAVAKVLVVDDHGLAGPYDTDLLVDQNLADAGVDHAALAPGARLLLGPRYALLRDEIVRARGAASGGRRTLLLALGGDPPVAARTLVARVEAWADGAGVPVQRLDGVDQVASPMAASGVALSAAGSTVWELAVVGVPVVAFTIAANQEAGARALARRGAIVDLGRVDALDFGAVLTTLEGLLDDPDRRRHLRAAAASLVDGLGASRLVTAMRMLMVDLRPAGEEDSRLLWEWANDARTRSSAFDPRPIPWDEHERWFAARREDPTGAIYMASVGGEALGQVRFDIIDGRAEVDVTVAPRWQGRGWGGPLIAAGARRFTGAHAAPVVAKVKPDNGASRRAFLQADFDEGPQESSGGHEWVRYDLRR
jgi:spore coat polysaccharide biosynthesis predicted glycosyltransferase SpsG/RimJ/RimL family protein N-acetyltransferase